MELIDFIKVQFWMIFILLSVIFWTLYLKRNK